MPSYQDCVVETKAYLEPLGYECHPFKVSWYNALVKPNFTLKYPDETLAVIVLSTPAMYEQSLVPFICKEDCFSKDPVDACVSAQIGTFKTKCPDTAIDVLYDYEMDHNRQPKVLVQTAGHVAGAARYYQRKDIDEGDPWPPEKNIYGVSIHPKYGGWFAFRAVIIFKDVTAPELTEPEIPDPVATNEARIELLKRFNERWQDWSYRDIISTDAKYSDEQKLYFGTMPKDRAKVLEQIKSKNKAGK